MATIFNNTKGNKMESKIVEVVGVLILGMVLGAMFAWGF
jgi:hypothetical protein